VSIATVHPMLCCVLDLGKVCSP